MAHALTMSSVPVYVCELEDPEEFGGIAACPDQWSLEELRLARTSGATMQLCLRKALRQDLDAPILPVRSCEGGCQVAMGCDDMAAIYKSGLTLRAHIVACPYGVSPALPLATAASVAEATAASAASIASVANAGDRQRAGVSAAQDLAEDVSGGVSPTQVVDMFVDEVPFWGVGFSVVAKPSDDGAFVRGNHQVQNVGAHISLFRARLDPAGPEEARVVRIHTFLTQQIEERRGVFARDFLFAAGMNRGLSTDCYAMMDLLAACSAYVTLQRLCSGALQLGGTPGRAAVHISGAQPHGVLRAVSGGGMAPL